MSRDVIESIIDVGSGFFLSVAIQITIFPLFDLYLFHNPQVMKIHQHKN